MRCFRCDRYIPTSMSTFVATVQGQQSNTGPHKMVVSALLCHDCGVHILSDLKGNDRSEKNFTFNVSTKELGNDATPMEKKESASAAEKTGGWYVDAYHGYAYHR